MGERPTGEYPQNERLELNRRIFPDPAVTILFRVPDDSMKSVKVRCGDMLVVEPSLTPCDGQFVVVVINGEQVVRQAIVHGGEAFIKPYSGGGELVRIGAPGAELIGVAKAFIPVVAEQDSSLSDLEVFMSNSNLSQPLRFAVLSVMNSYQRVVVGTDGEIFTLGWNAVQELAALNLVDQPNSAGTYRIIDDQTLEIRTKLTLHPPLSITVWSEYLLGVLAVYSYREAERTWYFWSPER